MSAPRYGDNIYAVGAVVGSTLRQSGWDREKIDAVLSEISAASSYDDAIAVCRRYITIKDADE
jgi:SOS response regulatory protein OraA/RecX